MKKETRKKILLLLIGTVITANALYWCVRKEGYYIDELWSYGLSNGYHTPFLHQAEGYMNNWHQPVFYWDYLTIQPDERFSFESVCYNQTQDVHPPFYYALLNTVCSLFPGRFSKWFGLSINLFFFGGSLILLYQISGFFFGKTSNARIIPVLLYGLSAGALSTLLYIRMYMMLTFWSLLFVCLVFHLLRETICRKRRFLLVQIGLSVMAGFMTQYYFVLFAFFFSACYVVFHLLGRQWKKALEYAVTACTGIIGGILVFPASLQHIFLGYQGKGALHHAADGIPFFLERWPQYHDVLTKAFLGSGAGKHVLFLTILCLFPAGVILFIKKGNQSAYPDFPLTECLMLLVSVLCYFAVIVQISPEVTDRYLFLLYPFCVLLAVTAALYLFRYLQTERFLWIAAACCLACLLRANAVQSNPYVYHGYQEVLTRLGTEYKDAPGIYVTAGDHLLINNCLFLAQQNRTYSLTLEQLNELSEICKENETGQIILYVDIYYDEAQTAMRAAELLDYRSCSLLYDNTFTQIYLLSR